MKRKAIIAARNNRPVKKARVDAPQPSRVSDVGLFETLPLEIQHHILVNFLCVPNPSNRYVHTVISVILTCTRFKQVVDSAHLDEDFQWGAAYVRKFGDLDIKTKCNTAKDKFLKAHDGYLNKFCRHYLTGYISGKSITSLEEAKYFDPTMHFEEICEERDPDGDEDWFAECQAYLRDSVATKSSWMHQNGYDALLYTYLKHVFDSCTMPLELSVAGYVCRELPVKVVRKALEMWERREPDLMPQLAVDCLQDIRKNA